ncbi:carbohydrate ABC transporter permease [Spelaeicoccus albus]|uniref:Multiple sugar transport system permease protein n=1 Tax=Spelaeicoccus albus TaxID=1280376 RepID=A0A7Z0D5X3_9MICO|nr:carbohydrate ABC transporter permease [Spelaeicoccus albus]NYI69418.1 multiple sugar transport system permease protein [Spelaeicoccus albus]
MPTLTKPQTTPARVRPARRRNAEVGRRSMIVRALVAWAIALITMFPVAWLALGAFRDSGDVFSGKIFTPLTVHNFVYVLTEIPFPRYLLNSAIVSVSVTVVALLFHSMAAYALARLRFPGRDLGFTMILSTMLVSMPVILVPLFLIIKWLGLVDTYGGLIVPAIFNAFGIFLLRQYYLNIPRELEEAAELDGCGYPRLYWNVILPLSRPILASLGVLFFLANWNSFIWPLAITQDPKLWVIQLGISSLQGQYSSSWGYILAGALLAAVPTVVVFLLGQRWLVDSLKTSGSK